jgi:hypothetical protein
MNEQPLSIGWARRDITPPLPVCLCGQFHVRVATKILDPLTLTAWAVSTADDALIWVSCDLVGIPDDFHDCCRERLARELPDFDPAKLIISATHTHTAPYLAPMWHEGAFPPGTLSPRAYFEQVAQAAVEAAAEAWRTRSPGRISYGHGYAVCAHQRRMTYFHDLNLPRITGEKVEANAAMYGSTDTPEFKGFEGYVDHRIDFVFTYGAAGEPTGAVAALPCPAQATEWLDEVSADFWHEVRQDLFRRFGKNFQLLPLCCAAGDLAPRQQLQKPDEERMLELSGRTNRQAIAGRITAALDEAMSWSRKEMLSSAVLDHHAAILNVARRRITPAEYREVKSGLEQMRSLPPGEGLRQESARKAKMYRAEQILNRYEEQQARPDCSIEQHVVRLGDVAFCTCPQELFLNYALRIQARSPALSTMVIQLAGRGVRPIGYLPTAEAEQGGGYSACMYCCAVGSEGGQEMVEAAVDAIGKAFGR